jgi:GTPase
MKTFRSVKNFLLTSIVPRDLTDEQIVKDMKELKALVDTYEGEVVEFVVQRREVHDKGLYIGKGKIGEIKDMVKKLQIDVVVLNDIVKAGHIYEIKKILEKENRNIEVWDRVDLILEIFAKNAHSAEAKLQIELAFMRHMGPRIYGMGHEMSRQAGGIGGVGIGETNTELMKRHWRHQVKVIKDKIKKHTEDRERQLERRQRNGIRTVSLVGYTNAGKTSLFNLLTKKENIIKNALFVTLDSATGKVFLPNSKKEILLTDTIGFISNLPPTLIDAFKSTLLESIHADLLLIVVDASDEDIRKKIKVVDKILYDLKLENKKRIYVFNKIDSLSEEAREQVIEKYKFLSPYQISVKNNLGIEDLLSLIEKDLNNSTDYVSQETSSQSSS